MEYYSPKVYGDVNMALTSVGGISITGIISVLPPIEEDNRYFLGDFDEEELERLIKSTGIEKRKIVEPGQTCFDLAKIAAKNLLDDLCWRAEDVGIVIFVTQTPDYPLPGNAVLLQNYLGLSKSTIAFDVNLGCSGFVYGMWQISQLLSGISSQKGLLLVGDTTSTQYNKHNRKVAPLFGDAVSAIAFEKDQNTGSMVFDLGSDGAGAPYLMQPNGGARKPGGVSDMQMDGTQVFVFTLREVPKSVVSCLERQSWDLSSVDYVVMHQANKMMLERLRDKIGFSKQQMIISMGDVGNTSSASIPLALSMSLHDELTTGFNKLVFSGFGVGWSWGSVAYEQSPLKVCRLVDLAESFNISLS